MEQTLKYHVARYSYMSLVKSFKDDFKIDAWNIVYKQYSGSKIQPCACMVCTPDKRGCYS